jgi:hypothetical protein
VTNLDNLSTTVHVHGPPPPSLPPFNAPASALSLQTPASASSGWPFPAHLSAHELESCWDVRVWMRAMHTDTDQRVIQEPNIWPAQWEVKLYLERYLPSALDAASKSSPDPRFARACDFLSVMVHIAASAPWWMAYVAFHDAVSHEGLSMDAEQKGQQHSLSSGHLASFASTLRRYAQVCFVFVLAICCCIRKFSHFQGFLVLL